MMTDKSEKSWPSFNEELTRKTTEVLARWTDKYESGKITKREYYVLVNALWDVTSGLCDNQLSHLLAAIEKDLRKK